MVTWDTVLACLSFCLCYHALCGPTEEQPPAKLTNTEKGRCSGHFGLAQGLVQGILAEVSGPQPVHPADERRYGVRGAKALRPEALAQVRLDDQEGCVPWLIFLLDFH